MPKKVALIDTEQGTDSVSNLIQQGTVVVYPARSLSDLGKAFQLIRKTVDDYDRIVVDTTTTLSTSINNELLTKGGTMLWANRGAGMSLTQQQWGEMSSRMILFFRDLQELPLPVILVCHEGIRENPYDGIEVHAPDINKMVLKELYGMNDAIIRLGKLPSKTNIGGTDYPLGTRVLRLQDSPQFMAKGRDALPYQRPELLANPTLASFLKVCNPEPRKIVLYGPPGVGKTVFACSEMTQQTTKGN